MSPPADADWLRASADGVRLSLRVQPKASADRIEGVREGSLRVRVTAAPEKGKANARVTRLLSKALGVPRSKVRIVSGERSRNKVALVGGATVAEVSRRLDG